MRWLRRALAFALLAGACALACMSIPAAGRDERATNPLLSLRRTLAEAPLVGRVEQRIVAGSYTYLALRGGDGALHWAATMGRAAPLGARGE
jgi:hypothetical protein